MAQYIDDPAPEPADDDAGNDLPLIELETLLNRPPSRQKRLAQLGLGLVAGVVLLAMFWSSLVPGKPTTTASAPTPTPLPPSLSIQSNVNYGTITINGKKQAWSLPMSIPVRGNDYTVSLDAPPFRQVTCHLSLHDLESSGSTQEGKNCFIDANTGYLAPGTPAFQLSIFFTADDLPSDQQSQVTGLLTQALTIQRDTTVPVGSYFATGYPQPLQITSQRASTPLRATATIAPLAPKIPVLPSCVNYICPLNLTAGSATGHLWAMSVMLALRWRFSTASGALVSDVLFQGEGLYLQVQTSALVYLSRDGSGAWAISPKAPVPDIPNQLADSFCNVGETILQQVAPPGENGDVESLQDRGAQGCAWVVRVNNVDQGTFIWRYGVLLAADAKTHAAYPQLPVAPPAEIVDLGG